MTKITNLELDGHQIFFTTTDDDAITNWRTNKNGEGLWEVCSSIPDVQQTGTMQFQPPASKSGIRAYINRYFNRI